jgi:hypothetical protein
MDVLGATAAEIARRRFGRPVALVKRAAFLSSTATSTVLENNPRRVGWLIQNIGANDAYLDFRANLDPTTAILITRLGSTLAATVDEDGEMTGWALYGQGATTGTTIVILEFIAR